MTTKTESLQHATWLGAMAAAAKAERFELPPFDAVGMGALRSATTFNGRFVTLKRRLRSR